MIIINYKQKLLNVKLYEPISSLTCRKHIFPTLNAQFTYRLMHGSVFTWGARLKFHGGPKLFFDISKGKSYQVVTHSKNFLIKETSKINKIWGLAGQIKCFHGPHLACGPYVVHARLILTQIYNILRIEMFSSSQSCCN